MMKLVAEVSDALDTEVHKKGTRRTSVFHRAKSQIGEFFFSQSSWFGLVSNLSRK